MRNDLYKIIYLMISPTIGIPITIANDLDCVDCGRIF